MAIPALLGGQGMGKGSLMASAGCCCGAGGDRGQQPVPHHPGGCSRAALVLTAKAASPGALGVRVAEEMAICKGGEVVSTGQWWGRCQGEVCSQERLWHPWLDTDLWEGVPYTFTSLGAETVDHHRTSFRCPGYATAPRGPCTSTCLDLARAKYEYELWGHRAWLRAGISHVPSQRMKALAASSMLRMSQR